MDPILIFVAIPDKEARKQIFHIHTTRKPLDSDVNLDKLVEMTNGMTGADVAAIVNAAAMTAIKEHVSKKAGKLKISLRHFEAALNKEKRGSSKGNTRDLQSLPVGGSLTQIPVPSHA
jgi:transitional endoplasmic reticulum ATPase